MNIAPNSLILLKVALGEKNRRTVVNAFYEQLYQLAFSQYNFDFSDNRYLIFDGKQAVDSFLGLRMPRFSTPVKTLKEIIEFAENIAVDYSTPSEKRISADKVKGIMDYLDNKYDFSHKVFRDKKALFLLLDVSHVSRDSECFADYIEERFFPVVYLYHMCKGSKETITPEAILFHELGHILHARCFGDYCMVPDSMVALLKKFGFSKIDTLSAQRQSEIFADVFSIGMMYEGPFETYDYHTYVSINNKRAYKIIIEQLLNNYF